MSPASWPSWLTPEKARAAMVRAAKRSPRPLEAGPLAASAGIGHIITERGARALCIELARAGELIKERRQSPHCLWHFIEVYSAPVEAGP